MRLFEFLPDEGFASHDELLGRFLDYTGQKNIQLYPAQETAILELFENKNVILNTPTGSGKSLVAMAGHFAAIAQGRRSVYTCPIKALVNEKWMTLCKEFGPTNVGLSTGDATVNRDAPILCCTAEILANIALRQGEQACVQEVIMDEFHYYADRDRGVAWQVPLLTLPQARFLLMSATLGDTRFFERELTRLNSRPTVSVSSNDRPVPLEFEYVETLLPATIETLIAKGRCPAYVVHFTQLEAAQNAQSFTSLNICTREEKEAIAEALIDFQFNSPHGPDIKRWIRQGIGIHHAGLLPKYRVLVEQLAQKGLLKIICGTDTLGVGINVPIRTVLFTRLCKFDGKKTAILSARDFHQISGRAGRKGFDNLGWVIAQAPEHIIENMRLEQKRIRDGKKATKHKAPEHNFVNWDRNTFERLIHAAPECLMSRFQVTHSMLLNVLSRESDGCAAMRNLIADCHEPLKQKQIHRNRAWQLFRSLLNRKIFEFIPRTSNGAKIGVNVELQDDFSMDQTLSLYLLETIVLIDPYLPEYPFILLSLVESILEDPDFILRKQLDRVKTLKMEEMKKQGIPFEERIEQLETLEYPKPNREFIYSTFNAFADRHPWVGQENIRPKSIALEMYESFRSFGDYVRDYGLERAEGLLLRHLHSVYKVLAQTVPEKAKDDIVQEIELYLFDMIRNVDSSLLDEWKKMQDPSYHGEKSVSETKKAAVEETPPDITRDTKAFTALIRARVFSLLRAIQIKDFDAALEALNGCSQPRVDMLAADNPTGSWDAEALRACSTRFLSDHQAIKLDPNARNLRNTFIKKAPDGRTWQVTQMIIDPDEQNDWAMQFTIDIDGSRTAQRPIMALTLFDTIESASEFS